MQGMRLLIVLAIGILLVSGPTSAAGKPRVSEVILSDIKDGAQTKTVFGTLTPKIYAAFRLADVPRNTTLMCAWVAEKTAVAPPNYEIDRVNLKVGGLINRGTCSLSKPTNNWPLGEYRVDLYLASELSLTVRFRVR